MYVPIAWGHHHTRQAAPRGTAASVPLRSSVRIVPRHRSGATRVRYQGDDTEQATREHPTTTVTGGRTFLLAVDESEDSKYAVKWALQHLCQAGDKLQLLHVIPLLPQPAGHLLPQLNHGVHPSLVAAATQQQWEQRIGSMVAAPIEEAGVSWGMQLLQEPVPAPEGPAAKAAVGDLITAAAASCGATAIIAASASPGGLTEWLRGSVTHHLMQAANLPVVVLHRPQQPKGGRSGSPWWLAATIDATEGGQQQRQPEPPAAGPVCGRARTLLVGVDDSPDSAAAVSWVVQQLWHPGDSLHLLHVVPVLPAVASYSLAPDGMLYTLPLPPLTEAKAEEEKWCTTLEERFAPLLSAAGVPYQLDVVASYGADPLEGVADTVRGMAERLGADVLVLSAHGKAAWEQWLLGSVSSYCAHHCQQPVVVLHGSRWM